MARYNRKMLTKREADSLFKAGGTLVENDHKSKKNIYFVVGQNEPKDIKNLKMKGGTYKSESPKQAYLKYKQDYGDVYTGDVDVYETGLNPNTKLENISDFDRTKIKKIYAYDKKGNKKYST